MNFGIVDQNGGRHFIANEIYNVKIFREGYDAYFLFKLKSKNNQDPVFRKGVGEYIYSVLVPNHYGLTDFVKKSDSVFLLRLCIIGQQSSLTKQFLIRR